MYILLLRKVAYIMPDKQIKKNKKIIETCSPKARKSTTSSRTSLTVKEPPTVENVSTQNE